jgi:hypothetical protein
MIPFPLQRRCHFPLRLTALSQDINKRRRRLTSHLEQSTEIRDSVCGPNPHFSDIVATRKG